MTRWPHQVYAVEQVLAAIEAGEKRICLTSPTGGGKTRMLMDIIEALVFQGWYVPLFSNRLMLIDQLCRSLTKAGIAYGVRNADTKEPGDQPVQICSLPTERSRTLGLDAKWKPHGHGKKVLAIVDEAHCNTSPTCRELLDYYEAYGGVRLGITATPLDLGDMYSHLIVAGCNSSLRACGALVPAYHFAPDEPSSKWMPKVSLGDDLSEKSQEKAMMTPTVFGRVMHHWHTLNPEHRPTVLFGPGKDSALWLAEQFALPRLRRKEDKQMPVVSAAHIDGECCWLNGQAYRTSENARDEIAAMHREGAVKVVSNRYVLREGIDWPWVEHLILAFVPGSPKTYLQTGGRGLRACPETGKTGCVIQDHGGCWWRHGSLNADRTWTLGQTSREAAALKLDRDRNPQPGDAPQAAVCPQCKAILRSWKCRCGYEIPRGSTRSRPVVELDGTLSEMRGDPVKRHRHMKDEEKAAKLWERMWHRARSEKWNATFFQAEAMFAQENNFSYPPRGIPLMPMNQEDMHRKVRDVPMEKLVPKLEAVPQ